MKVKIYTQEEYDVGYNIGYKVARRLAIHVNLEINWDQAEEWALIGDDYYLDNAHPESEFLARLDAKLAKLAAEGAEKEKEVKPRKRKNLIRLLLKLLRPLGTPLAPTQHSQASLKHRNSGSRPRVLRLDMCLTSELPQSDFSLFALDVFCFS